MNNAWMNATSGNLAKGFSNVPSTTASTTGAGLASTLSKYTPYIGPATAALSYAKDPLGKLNQDLSNPLSGAMTGAAIGSYGGPVGAAIGGIIGLGAGTVGRAFGLGKTKYAGYEPVSSNYNQPGQLTRLDNENQYNAYNNAMNYLSNYTGTPIGASEIGNDIYKTKRIGHNKKTYVPVYSANLNTGNNVLDAFSNSIGYAGNALDAGWDAWRDREADIYQGRLDRLVGKPNYNLSNYYDIAREVNAQQRQDNEDKLYRQKVMGYLDGNQYNNALKQLNEDSTRNLLGMFDIGKNQTNQWKIDMNQLYDDYKNADSNDWIKYFGNYDAAERSGDAADAVQAYKDNFVSDNILRYLMQSGSFYEPYRYMSTGIAQSPIDLSLNGWSNNRRKAVPLYQEG